ncbi:MAG: hypothetical protein JSW41_00835 [Candidatus Aenigmatarchaeota archaeon]|nr:MAG: hypothetical protein JSW41_00835 [Candidatus Aenigmarchaeota archaeon]
MRKYIKDISHEEKDAYQIKIALGIFEFGAPREGGDIGLYQIGEHPEEPIEPPKKNNPSKFNTVS